MGLDLVGPTIGPYRVDALLGVGGMGDTDRNLAPQLRIARAIHLGTMPVDRSALPRPVTSVPGDAVMHPSLSPSMSHAVFLSNATGSSRETSGDAFAFLRHVGDDKFLDNAAP